MSLPVNLGFVVQDARSEGPRADSPDALTCLGSGFVVSLFPAWHCCHWIRAGTWWFAAARASVGRQSVVSPPKVASCKVAGDFPCRVSSQLLQGHHLCC